MLPADTSSVTTYAGDFTGSLDGTSTFSQTSSYSEYAVSASYEINYETSSSYADFAQTSSYMSGSITNIGDTYSTPFISTIITLTQAEYDAIVTKNPNALYAIV
jgi:hypothetical protein